MRNPKTTLIVTAALWLAGAVPTAWAYEPSLAEIVENALPKESAVSRAIIHFHTRVFDPLAAQAGAGSPAAPEEDVPGVSHPEPVAREQPQWGYRQVVYWVRGVILAVETASLEGEELHFYADEGFLPVSKGFSEARPFSDWDIRPAYLPFLATTPEGWLRGLGEWGVYPATVDLVRTRKGDIYYRLLESPGNWLWVNRATFRPVRLQTTVGEGEQALALTIEFSEWAIYGDHPSEPQNLIFPRTVNFLLNGRLAKQTVVQRFEADPSWRSFPLTKLRQRARELAAAQAVSQLSRERP